MLPLKGNYPGAQNDRVDVFHLLDELEELPEKAKRFAFKRPLFGFDEDRFYYLVLKLRANLPEDMKTAQRVARDSERIVDEAKGTAVQQLETSRAEASKIVEEARTEAQRILDKAQQQAALLVERSEIHQMATAQARDIIARSETEAGEIRKGADDYARDVLTNLESIMGRAMATVQRGRETLENSLG